MWFNIRNIDIVLILSIKKEPKLALYGSFVEVGNERFRGKSGDVWME